MMIWYLIIILKASSNKPQLCCSSCDIVWCKSVTYNYHVTLLAQFDTADELLNSPLPSSLSSANLHPVTKSNYSLVISDAILQRPMVLPSDTFMMSIYITLQTFWMPLVGQKTKTKIQLFLHQSFGRKMPNKVHFSCRRPSRKVTKYDIFWLIVPGYEHLTGFTHFYWQKIPGLSGTVITIFTRHS